jgi:hypothetical protein
LHGSATAAFIWPKASTLCGVLLLLAIDETRAAYDELRKELPTIQKKCARARYFRRLSKKPGVTLEDETYGYRFFLLATEVLGSKLVTQIVDYASERGFEPIFVGWLSRVCADKDARRSTALALARICEKSQNLKWRDDLASHIREIALAPKETSETVDYRFPDSSYSPSESTGYHLPNIPLFKETGTKGSIPFAELVDWDEIKKALEAL